MRTKQSFLAILMLLLGTLSVLADSAAPMPPPRPTPRGGVFLMQGGEEIYRNVCQGCHMPDAQGAVGAGMYPKLARNENLQSTGYPAVVIVKGMRAMPEFGAYLGDEQIANVVNYIRSHFGNRYGDTITAADVKALR